MLQRDYELLMEVTKDDKWNEDDKACLTNAHIVFFLANEHCQSLEQAGFDDIIGFSPDMPLSLMDSYHNPFGEGKLQVVEIDTANDRVLLKLS